MAPNTLPKAPKNNNPRPGPLHADYSDDVTEEHMRLIHERVDQEQFVDAEEVSKPGW